MRTRIPTFCALAVTVLSCFAPPVSAQTSRAGQIAEQQAEKAARVEAEASPPAERVVKRIMSSPLLSGSGGVHPWFGSVYNGTGLAAGVGYLRRGARGERLTLTGAGSINGSIMGDASWRGPTFTPAGMVRPMVDIRWSRLEHISFHGVGATTSTADRSFFDYRPRTVTAGIVATPFRLVSLTASYGYLGFSTASETAEPRARPLPAVGESLDYGVVRLGGALDWRSSPGYSTSGGVLRGEWQRYGMRGDAPYAFDEVEVEAAHLVPLVREQFVLAFRVLATTTATTDGHAVPFILLPSIGGGDTVRGDANRRFHDRSRVVFTGEYRWRPSRFLDMALFLDSGAVAPRLGDIDVQPFSTGWGAGARFHGAGFTALRLEAAHGREGWRAIFAAGQPF
jgi:hypothetical protein